MSSGTPLDIGERRAVRHAGRPLRAVFIAFASFYVVAALLNGRFLHESAQEREFGKTRDVWVALTKPLYEISTTLGLDHYREAVQNLREE